MASDGDPVKIPATSLVHGSQAPIKVVPPSGGNPLPPSGKEAAAPSSPNAYKAPARSASTIQTQVALLNKYLNDSGRPDQFRVDPSSENKIIQEVNPANGDVIAEYPVIAFPELARSVGISGAVVDEHA